MCIRDSYSINLLVTNDTEINGTLLDRDWKYLVKNNFINKYEYNIAINKICLLNKNLFRPKIRLLFNDGG